MLPEIFGLVAQLLSAAIGRSKYYFTLLWLATLHRLYYDVTVDAVDWTVLVRREPTPFQRRMLVAPPQHWSAP
ncbi:hypothetical protein ASG20_06765 [Sphingomonas sp. Leaf198]|nr:hypothetical protein ASG20_06765 [Sphingomonas sp. Leaf198]